MSRLERKYSFYKKVAVLVCFNLVLQLVMPSVSFALTSGPSAPEYSSFEPVATTNMVNPFTGDFTYNLPVLQIPGANGGGYGISLSYHSGTTSEEEASWVGYGWTLNPGAINRGKMGFPDDWNGEEVTYHNKAIPVRTFTLGAGLSVEAFSIGSEFGGGVSASIRYNNYKGFGYSAGANLSFHKGLSSLGFNLTDGEGSFSLRVNPLALLRQEEENCEKVDARIERIIQKESKGKISAEKAARMNIRAQAAHKIRNKTLSTFASNYGLATFSTDIKPTNVAEYNGISANVSIGFIPTAIPIELGPSAQITGSYAQQKNVKETDHDVYGYMYNENAYADEDHLMDYYTEKGGDYHKKDKFLGIPHHNADQYAMSGEGIGGGFRLHNMRAGHFRPNEAKSPTNIINVGAEVEAGLNWGGGADIGYGHQSIKMGYWDNYFTSYNDQYGAGRESKYFRFASDLGGFVTKTGQNEEPEAATLNRTSGVPGFKVYKPDPSAIATSTVPNHETSRVGQSSYMAYNTNSEMTDMANGVNYNTYAKNFDLDDFINRGETEIADQVGEFSVLNEGGQRYTYGLPIYSRNEKSIQIDVHKIPNDDLDNFHRAYKDANIASSSVKDDLKVLIGEERDAPYATSYLLTSITDPDYIDRTNNGPTVDDFGGFTKFVYNQSYGSNQIAGDVNQGNKSTGGEWYKWRAPYTGLDYARNELSNRRDDLGGFSDGEREVYYLERVETKTHVAVFHTSPRLDALGAHTDAATASTTEGAKGSQELQKLDKIELFVRDAAYQAYEDDDYNPALKPKPLKVVNFGYDYSLVKGIPNTNGTGTETGKLTLKKVWFDHEGAYDAKISPYEFGYEYPDYTTYPTKYGDPSGDDYLSAIYEDFTPGEQNPDYNRFQLDGWGHYHGNVSGEARHGRLQDWLDQSLDMGDNLVMADGTPTSTKFDPAAWQLKTIKLPSGGEIHVQYEQDDYAYVQDQIAHVMVSVKPAGSVDVGATPRYYLNTDELDLSAVEINQLENLIDERYVNGKNKMYFKFLYNMSGANPSPELTDCDVEHISGYVKVAAVGQDVNGIYVEVIDDGARHDVPREVCEDFCKANRSGKFMITDCYDVSEDNYNSGTVAGVFANFFDEVTSIGFSFPGACAACDAINFNESYLRVPSAKAKKGGGLRVKRLMMYSPPLGTSGTSELYGSEYVYEFVDNDGTVRSSGVVPTEPLSFREENILVDNIDRLPQNFWDKLQDKIIAGRDSKQFEGPLGENLLGTPSVGYSKVIVKNIHSGATNTGYMVSEYHTCRDFPMLVDFTDLANNTKRDYLPLPGGFINKFTNNVWTTQGYSFKLNSMHGQPKFMASYAADYDDIHNPSSSSLVTATEYDYFGLDEELPIMNEIHEIEYMPLGRETDVCFESRFVKDNLVDGHVEFDVDVGVLIIPLPFGSFMPSLTWNETEMYTHVTNKVTTYPAIVKSQRSFTDGMWSQKDFLAFSSRTGQPLVTRTFDDFNKPDGSNLNIDGVAHAGWMTKYDIPAYRDYENMDQVALNEREIISSGTDFTIDKIHDPSDQVTYLELDITNPAACDLLGSLETGALIKLSSGEQDLYHISAINGPQILLEPTYYSAYGISGTDFSASAIDFEIIRSGRNNMVNVHEGMFITYGEVGEPGNPFKPQMTIFDLSDPSHPDHADYLARMAFANSLNSVLPGGGSVIIPPGLLEDPDHPGDCFGQGGVVTIKPGRLGFSLVVSGLGSTTVTDRFFAEPGNSGWVNLVGKDFIAVRNATTGGASNTGTGLTEVSTLGSQSISRTFMDFNTSPIPSTATVIGAVLGISYDGGITVSAQKATHSSALNVADYDAFTGTSYGNVILPTGSGVVPMPLGGTALTDIDISGVTKMCVREFNYDYQSIVPAPDIQEQARIHFKGEEDVISYLDVTYSLPSECVDFLFEMHDGGQFEVDPATGALVYNTGGVGCLHQDVPCLKFCNDIFPKTVIENVIAATASTLGDIWNYDETEFNYSNTNNNNNYELAKLGKWRVKGTYSYEDATTGMQNPFNPFTSSATDEIYNYNSGLFTMELFNWKYPTANNSELWLQTNMVNRYSPNGNAEEEENLIGLKSAAKYGYNKSRPYLVSVNSNYEASAFESFENEYTDGTTDYFEDNVARLSGTSRTSAEKHTGAYSLQAAISTALTPIFTSNEMPFNTQVQTEGMHVKLWVKGLADGEVLKVRFVDPVSSTFEEVNFAKVAQAGEWTLHQVDYFNWSAGFTPDDIRVEILAEGTSSHNIYVDDIRIQPLQAEMMCYVYDLQTLRLTAIMDDQHFAMKYIYDGEGKLTRRVIETERGMKTISETQYNSPTQFKNNVLNGLSN